MLQRAQKLHRIWSRRSIRDAAVIAGVCFITYIAGAAFDIFGHTYEFVKRYEAYELDEMSTAERFQASVAEQKQASGARMRRHAKGPDRAPLHVGGENCSAANGR